ncbi:Uncharacterised protein [Segatella buccae]|uniref:Uncharacterized protein n=1 Tax=Segatella buccae TaxID=28126 RepID=A0AAQ1UG79_9BACT|nr:Uncharacterised protein [Segatella buccae]DAT66974.1 MAG TPA: hypothetical protein [Caudoviricetes sp.]
MIFLPVPANYISYYKLLPVFQLKRFTTGFTHKVFKSSYKVNSFIYYRFIEINILSL